MNQRRHRGGFTLVELSIILAIVGLIVGGVYTIGTSTLDQAWRTQTRNKLDAIEDALMMYRTAYNRLPCPADPALLTTNASYGREGDCATGTVKVDSTHNVVEGGVPFKTLNLPEEFMYDAWGRKFAYAVNPSVTSTQAMASMVLTDQCGISVTDAGGRAGARTSGAVYALVSFGSDGHGGYLKNGTRVNAGATNTEEQTNAHYSNLGVAQAYSASYVMHDHTEDSTDSKKIFDDQVRFKERWQMMTADDPYVSGGPVCGHGFVFNGTYASEKIGWGASSAQTIAVGDINGDGIADFVIIDPAGWASSGQWQAFVVFGQAGGIVPSTLDATQLTGANGFVINSPNSWGGLSGGNVAVGDINKDGYADIVLNASTGAHQGAYVIFGGPGPMTGANTYSASWPASFNLSALNGTNGFVIPDPSSLVGSMVTLGDINGDGYVDILISHDMNNNSGIDGDVSVVFGGPGPKTNDSPNTWSASWPSTCPSNVNYSACFDLTTLNGQNGFKAISSTYAGQAGIYLGHSVIAGDLSGDGIADLVIQRLASNKESAYVLFGKKSGWTTPYNLDGMGSSDGFLINNIASNKLGTTMAIGDFNGDGHPDLMLGESYGYSLGWPVDGHIVWGPIAGYSVASPLDLHAASYPSVTALTGISGNIGAGQAIAAADFNEDGVQDILFGVPSASPNGVSSAGSTYVLYGNSTPGFWSSTFDLSTLNTSNTNGFRVGSPGTELEFAL